MSLKAAAQQQRTRRSKSVSGSTEAPLAPANSISGLKKLSKFKTIMENPINLNYVEDDEIFCKNCENMAKNFLYLEGIIRASSNIDHCPVCQGTLRYLTYVNRSIKSVFGQNYDQIVKAAERFMRMRKKPVKAKPKKEKKLRKKDLSTILTLKIDEEIKRVEGGGSALSGNLNGNKKIQILTPVYAKSTIKRKIVDHSKPKETKKRYIIVKKMIKMPKKVKMAAKAMVKVGGGEATAKDLKVERFDNKIKTDDTTSQNSKSSKTKNAKKSTKSSSKSAAKAAKSPKPAKSNLKSPKTAAASAKSAARSTQKTEAPKTPRATKTAKKSAKNSAKAKKNHKKSRPNK